jgi:hypothetical protein
LLKLVRTYVAVDVVKGLSEVGGQGVGGGDGVVVDLDFDGAVAAGGADEFLIDQPVWFSIQRLTAKAAKTMVRWASSESRVRW